MDELKRTGENIGNVRENFRKFIKVFNAVSDKFPGIAEKFSDLFKEINQS